MLLSPVAAGAHSLESKTIKLKINGQAQLPEIKPEKEQNSSEAEAYTKPKSGGQLSKQADKLLINYHKTNPPANQPDSTQYYKGILNKFSSLYGQARASYEKKQYRNALENSKKARPYAETLRNLNLLPADTVSALLYLGGSSADRLGQTSEAAAWYQAIAENHSSGAALEEIYYFLVTHNFIKQDYAAFDRYLALGAKLYPDSYQFKFDRVDFAEGLINSFAAKLQALEGLQKQMPGNFKVNQHIGELIYKELHESSSKNATLYNTLETKMLYAYTMAAKAATNNAKPFICIANHWYSKAGELQEAMDQFKDSLANRPDSSPADQAALVAMEINHAETLENARYPFELAAALLMQPDSTRTPYETYQNQQALKKLAFKLLYIYTHKAGRTNPGSELEAEFLCERQHWLAVYTAIK